MAQAGYTPIKLYYSATASAVPTAGNLADGELALNITDGKLFYKDNLGSVQLIASKSGASGSVTSVAFSTGTTGLTVTGSPITTSGTITLAGTLATANGGTNLTSFTANQVFYASSTSAIGQSANLTFDGTTLTAANFADSSLTSGRVVYAGASGNLTDSSNFTFDGSNLQIGSQGDLRFGDSDNSNWVAFQSPATVASNVTWTLPSTDGTNGQALTTNGTGTLSWSTVAGAPGGSNTQIQYNNAGAFAGASGLVTDGSNLTLNAQGDLRFADSDSSNWVAFQAPATIASNITWTLPNADGTSGQFLSTDGAGTLSWATASGGGGGGGTSVTVTQITATASQTTFNVTYTVGQISVYLNGALLAAADYTATNGTTVVLATGAAANDIFTAVVYSSVTQIIQGNTSVAVSDSGSNGTITFTTDGSERGRFNSSGYLLLGTTTSSANYGIPLLQLDNSSGPEFSLRRAATADGSTVGFMTGYSTHGLIGLMSFITDGAQTASSTPGALRFMTQASGATGSPSERMRITAAGNVGIGRSSYTSMTTNGAWFDIGVFTHMSNTSNTNATLFLNQNGTGAMQEWRLANDVKGTFNQYGLGLGTAVPSSGIGICFPGTQSASSNGNTLDDYEEGTWTPATPISSLTTAYAIYTKIGRFVCLAFDITIAANASTTGITITGVPFAANSSGSFTGTLIADNFNVLNVNPFINAAATSVGFMISSTTGGGRSTVGYSQVNASGVLRAVVCYMTD